MADAKNFIHKCDQFMAFCFYALIYFLPISIALSETFINLALVTYFIKRITSFVAQVKTGGIPLKGKPVYSKISTFFRALKPIQSCLSWPIAIVLFFSVISILFSQYMTLSIHGFFGKTLQNAFIFFTFIECIRSVKRLKIFLVTFFISSALICVNGLFQYFQGHGFIHGHVFEGQVYSSLRQANDFGSYLVIVTPVLFCLTVYVLNGIRDRISQERSQLSFLGAPATKVVITLLFLLALICLGLTYSRGAWLSFAVGIFLLSMNDRKRFLLAVLFIVIFVALFGPGMIESRDGLDNMKMFFENNNRFLYWPGALEVIKDYPLFGAGLNTYSHVRSQYEIEWGGYPHNCYLQMLAEVGIFGLAAFLWLLFRLFQCALRFMKKMPMISLKTLHIGFLTGLGAFVFHAFWDTAFYSVQLSSLMWVVMGLIIAIQKISIQGET
jgi:putative inorganic carbon (HCO3(-)) transporter